MFQRDGGKESGRGDRGGAGADEPDVAWRRLLDGRQLLIVEEKEEEKKRSWKRRRECCAGVGVVATT